MNIWRKKNSDTKIIVVTANNDFDIVYNIYNLKMDGYLFRSVRKRILTDVIKRALASDEGENKKSHTLKQKVFAMINDYDYIQWHNFVFDTFNGACPVDIIEEDKHKNVIDFPEMVSQHITARGGRLMSTNRKVTALIKGINQYNMVENRCLRIMTSLLTIGEELSGYTLKGYIGNTGFIERAEFHIERSILGDLTLDDVATKPLVSACYLSYAFKRITGLRFLDYIAMRKIAIVKSLSRFSDLQTNTTALKLVYQDSSYFYRTFKKDIGMTPFDYRKVVSPGIAQ